MYDIYDVIDKGDKHPMKKVVTMVLMILIMLFMSAFSVSLATEINTADKNATSELMDAKNTVTAALDKYTSDYGSQSYGTVAYVLHMISIYSIPVCFLGIIVGAIAMYAFGTRRLDLKHKGSRMMMAFITLLVIAQVLPLVFALVVRGWVQS